MSHWLNERARDDVTYRDAIKNWRQTNYDESNINCYYKDDEDSWQWSDGSDWDFTAWCQNSVTGM